MGALRKVQSFESDDPYHEGRLKIPIGRLVAFPNIGKEESCRKGYKRLIPPSDSIFKEELNPMGEIWGDTSGKKFHEKVCRTCPFPFEGLTESEIGKLKAAFLLSDLDNR